MARFKPLLAQMAVDLLQGLWVSEPTAEQIIAAELLIITMFEQEKPRREQRLPLKEWQCLYWASQGRTIQETADLLQISTATVKAYRGRVKTKLQCKNLANAIHETNQNDFYLLVENSKK
jgi:DNA-binding CsgD family transcriptional regulator